MKNTKKKKATFVTFFFLVPLTGLEPVRCCHRGILSPLRLPISPQRHFQIVCDIL